MAEKQTVERHEITQTPLEDGLQELKCTCGFTKVVPYWFFGWTVIWHNGIIKLEADPDNSESWPAVIP